MRIKQIYVLRVMSLLVFFVIAAGGALLFSSTAADDAATVARLAEEGTFKADSYGMMARVYALVPPSLSQIVIYIIGSWFIIFCTRKLVTNVHGYLMLLLILAPSILTVSFFQKDLILVPFVIFATLCIDKISKKLYCVSCVVVIYAIYAYLFRDYYYLIIFFFVSIIVFKDSGIFVKLILVSSIFVAITLTPVNVFQALQGSRDVINFNRLHDPGAVGTRSAFMNLLSIDGPVSFLVNYVYAFLRLNFAAIINPGPREFFLQINVMIYFFAMFRGFKQDSESSKIAASLLLAHIIVLTFFEPDLGSYLRHLASTLPIATIPIIFYFSENRWRLKRFRLVCQSAL